jgi:hypothetical protein
MAVMVMMCSVPHPLQHVRYGPIPTDRNDKRPTTFMNLTLTVKVFAALLLLPLLLFDN